VRIGSRVKIHNHVSIFEGVMIEDGVFVGPHACRYALLNTTSYSPVEATISLWVDASTSDCKSVSSSGYLSAQPIPRSTREQ
jgi:hypothetical protein